MFVFALLLVSFMTTWHVAQAQQQNEVAEVIIAVETARRFDIPNLDDKSATYLGEWIGMVSKQLPLAEDQMRVAITHVDQSNAQLQLALRTDVSSIETAVTSIGNVDVRINGSMPPHDMVTKVRNAVNGSRSNAPTVLVVISRMMDVGDNVDMTVWNDVLKETDILVVARAYHDEWSMRILTRNEVGDDHTMSNETAAHLAKEIKDRAGTGITTNGGDPATISGSSSSDNGDNGGSTTTSRVPMRSSTDESEVKPDPKPGEKSNSDNAMPTWLIGVIVAVVVLALLVVAVLVGYFAVVQPHRRRHHHPKPHEAKMQGVKGKKSIRDESIMLSERPSATSRALSDRTQTTVIQSSQSKKSRATTKASMKSKTHSRKTTRKPRG